MLGCPSSWSKGAALLAAFFFSTSCEADRAGQTPEGVRDDGETVSVNQTAFSFAGNTDEISEVPSIEAWCGWREPDWAALQKLDRLAIPPRVSSRLSARISVVAAFATFFLADVKRAVLQKRDRSAFRPEPCINMGDEAWGHLDRKEIQKIVRGHLLKEVRACYRIALGREDELAGTLRIRFQIRSRGAVGCAEILDDGVGDVALANCVLAEVKRWKFPDPQGTVTVIYPFVFERVD